MVVAANYVFHFYYVKSCNRKQTLRIMLYNQAHTRGGVFLGGSNIPFGSVGKCSVIKGRFLPFYFWGRGCLLGRLLVCLSERSAMYE